MDDVTVLGEACKHVFHALLQSINLRYRIRMKYVNTSEGQFSRKSLIHEVVSRGPKKALKRLFVWIFPGSFMVYSGHAEVLTWVMNGMYDFLKHQGMIDLVCSPTGLVCSSTGEHIWVHVPSFHRGHKTA